MATLPLCRPHPWNGAKDTEGWYQRCWGKADKLVKEPLDLLSNSAIVFWKLRVCSIPSLGQGHRLNKVALTPGTLHSKWDGEPFGWCVCVSPSVKACLHQQELAPRLATRGHWTPK